MFVSGRQKVTILIIFAIINKKNAKKNPQKNTKTPFYLKSEISRQEYSQNCVNYDYETSCLILKSEP